MAVVKKVSIIGGCGHIGLPLGIALAITGSEVVLIDRDENAINTVNDGHMPFIEENGQFMLEKAINTGLFKATNSFEEITDSQIVIVTIGTPVDEHQSPVPRIFADFLDSIENYLSRGQLLILRSTVFPGTSRWIAKRLQPKGVEVAFCPERIVQGKAFDEFSQLPQIIATQNQNTAEQARQLFSQIGSDFLFGNFEEAEFAKLFLNAYRYIQFATTNEFFMIANDAGVDYAKVHNLMTEGYDRGRSLPKAGFASGPCLLKDTQQLLAFGQNKFQIGNSAILINEGLALKIVNIAEEIMDLSECVVGVLGMAFKSDNDDIRSSLSYRVRKMLQLKAKKVLSSDPFVKNDFTLVEQDFLIENSDLIIVCTPHSAYKHIEFGEKKVIDIWNIHGNGLLFQ
jgi:UDP-N-acetyl-D-mannosaminuronic acid dehydrogenase